MIDGSINVSKGSHKVAIRQAAPYARTRQDVVERRVVRYRGRVGQFPGRGLAAALFVFLNIERAAALVLVIGNGNPSRGDDAIGPLAIERLEGLSLPEIELLTNFQLQVEYALDLVGREEVIFTDASVSGPGLFSFEPVLPRWTRAPARTLACGRAGGFRHDIR